MTSVKDQILNGLGWFLDNLNAKFTQKSDIVNNVTSTSTDAPLSAAQGKVLQDNITALNSNLSQQINELNENLWQKVYPIGSVYISVNSTNPSSLFGGTWVAWGAGRVPVGINTSDGDFNNVEKTGGSKTHIHGATTSGAASGTTGSTTLSVDQIPAHGHSVDDGSGGVLTWPRNTTGWGWHDGGWNNDAVPCVSAIKTTQNVGGNQGHTHSLNAHTHSIPASSGNNMPPYITCYMWRRTA